MKFTPNGWYIRVKEVLRDPNSDTHFYDRAGEDTPYTFDAESVVATDVQLKKLTQKRRYGANSKWWVLPEDEVVRCTEAGQTEFSQSHMPAAAPPPLQFAGQHGPLAILL